MKPDFAAPTAAVLLIFGLAPLGSAEDKAEKKDDLARLQGTWKVVESDFQGKRAPVKRDQVWIFSGNKLVTRLDKYEPIAFEFEIDPDSNPKKLDLRQRARNVRISNPERLGYRFVGENLEVVTGRNLSARPTSFDSAANDGEYSVQIFQRIGDETKIPDEVLSEFEDDPPLHSKNRAAEEALLKFFKALVSGEPWEKIEPLVHGGKAKLLREMFDPRPELPPDRAAELERFCVRDVAVGERVYYADGTPLVLQAKDLAPNKALLMLLDGRQELTFFWLHKVGGQWQVDVSNLIEFRRAPGRRVLAGIREGMSVARVKELLAGHRQAAKLKSFKVVKLSDRELTYSWDDGGGVMRHTFRFDDGALTGYAVNPESLFK